MWKSGGGGSGAGRITGRLFQSEDAVSSNLCTYSHIHSSHFKCSSVFVVYITP